MSHGCAHRPRTSGDEFRRRMDSRNRQSACVDGLQGVLAEDSGTSTPTASSTCASASRCATRASPTTRMSFTPLQLDKETGALFFPGGGLTEGSAVQLTRRDAEKFASLRVNVRPGFAKPRGPYAGSRAAVRCAGRGRILWGPARPAGSSSHCVNRLAPRHRGLASTPTARLRRSRDARITTTTPSHSVAIYEREQ